MEILEGAKGGDPFIVAKKAFLREGPAGVFLPRIPLWS
jgi:hypothetical protein